MSLNSPELSASDPLHRSEATVTSGWKWNNLRAQLSGVCEHARPRAISITKGFLGETLEAEWHGRYQRGVENTPQARPAAVCQLEQFDFDFRPSIDRKQMRKYCRSPGSVAPHREA